jgi:branched-chain amino acid transport system permease protein
MVYGIIELINFAHGEVYMIGAFTALIVSSVLAFVVAVFYAAAYGFTVERIAYRPLRQAPRLSPLISAIVMSIFLQNYVMLAQTSDFLPFPNLLPEFEFLKSQGFMGSSEFLIVVTTTVVMVFLTLLIKYTKMGKAMRATAQDREMAMLVGVNVNRTIAKTFIIGSALAAVGGVLIASHVGTGSIFTSASSPASRPSRRPFSAGSGAFPGPFWEGSSSAGRRALPRATSPATMKTSLPLPS